MAMPPKPGAAGVEPTQPDLNGENLMSECSLAIEDSGLKTWRLGLKASNPAA